MRVLVACERSGVVREEFRRRGHDAWSCDLAEDERGSRHHLRADVLQIIEDGWDLLIAHPPCTYLSSSGLHWNKRVPGRDKLTHEATIFAINLMGDGFINHGIKKVAMENPIGRLSTAYRKPDQIIQPWQFGHDASKATCLWLKGLALLKPTTIIEPPEYGCKRCKIRFSASLGKHGCPSCHGAGGVRSLYANQTVGGQNKLGPSSGRAMDRARTYHGIAKAMADQWGRDDLVCSQSAPAAASIPTTEGTVDE